MKTRKFSMRYMSIQFPVILTIVVSLMLLVAMAVSSRINSSDLTDIVRQIEQASDKQATINRIKQQNMHIKNIAFTRFANKTSPNSWFFYYDQDTWLCIQLEDNPDYGGHWLVPGMALIFMLLIFWITSWIWIKHRLIRPLFALNNRLNEIINSQGFNIRVPMFYQDETGDLVNVMNRLLDHIHSHDIQLKTEKVRAELSQNKLQKSSEEMAISHQRLEHEMEIRVKIQSKLASTQSYLNSILNSLSTAVIAINEQGIITHWNVAATHLTQIDMEKALNFTPEQASPILAKCQVWIDQSMHTRQNIVHDKVSFTIAGEHKTLDVRVHPLLKSGSKGVVLRLEDNCEQHKMEEIMVQTEKMMSVGGLAAGMAHEINNPLGAIIQNSQNVARRLSPDLLKNQQEAEAAGLNLQALQSYLDNRNIPKFLNNISDAGERATNIVRNMLQFSRMGSSEKEQRDVVDIIDRTLQIAQSDLGLYKNIDIDISGLQNIVVACISVELEQVILNILKNAAHAIEAKQIEEKQQGAAQENALTTPYQGIINIHCQQELGFVQIHIKDNGTGMDEDVRKRIFEPFYTTKDIGSGTGLGLSVSYFIIQSHHNGRLQVNSTQGEGSEFVISLPLD